MECSTATIVFCLPSDGFFAKYNHVRHSGIGWHTPASVHQGTYGQVDDARQVTLNVVYAAHPAESPGRHRRRRRLP